MSASAAYRAIIARAGRVGGYGCRRRLVGGLSRWAGDLCPVARLAALQSRRTAGAITRPGTRARPDCVLAAVRGEETPDGIASRPELPCAVTPPECSAALGHVVAARPTARSSSLIGVGWSGYTHWSLCFAVLGRRRRAEPARVIREREEYADEGGEALT
jgi:hypothetical protein